MRTVAVAAMVAMCGCTSNRSAVATGETFQQAVARRQEIAEIEERRARLAEEVTIQERRASEAEARLRTAKGSEAASEARRIEEAQRARDEEERRIEAARPKPVELDAGEPVRHWALHDGELVRVVKYDDGWHLESRAVAAPTSGLQMLSDPKGVIRDRIRAVPSSYRGTEGWQSLRWGMTLKEVASAMKGSRLKPSKSSGVGAAWETEVADREATVACLFATDRLVTIVLTIPRIDEGVFEELLNKRYGTPTLVDEEMRTWKTKEGGVSASWDFLRGVVVYGSIIFAPEGREAMERLRAEQAKDL